MLDEIRFLAEVAEAFCEEEPRCDEYKYLITGLSGGEDGPAVVLKPKFTVEATYHGEERGKYYPYPPYNSLRDEDIFTLHDRTYSIDPETNRWVFERVPM